MGLITGPIMWQCRVDKVCLCGSVGLITGPFMWQCGIDNWSHYVAMWPGVHNWSHNVAV